MKKKTIKTEKGKIFRDLFDEHGMRLFGSDGSCACSHGDILGIKIETHCHKSPCEERHPYACVHITSIGNDDVMLTLTEIADLLSDYIAEAYMCEVDQHVVLQ